MRPSSLPRRRLLDLFFSGLLTSLISTFPFYTIHRDSSLFQPPSARLAFLLSIVLSWPCNLASSLISLIIYRLHRASEPDSLRLTPDDHTLLAALVAAAAFATLGLAFLLVAQAVWIYVAARARVVWLLCLVVLGLAMLVVVNASVVAVCVQAIRVRANSEDGKLGKEERMDVVLQIASDENSPQNVVAKISRHDSDLVF